MDRNLEHLLQPTLSSEEQRVPIFSVRACFFTAFFGGPLAVILLLALNSNRLKRLKNDLFFYLVGTLASLVYLFIILDIPEGADVSEWLVSQRHENMFYRYGSRGIGLFFWAAYYYLHKQYYKTMSLFDMEPPNPWIPAIICILAGGLLQFLLSMFVISIRGSI
jgi:hypothetical protein